MGSIVYSVSVATDGVSMRVQDLIISSSNKLISIADI